MHELSICQALISQVEQLAQEHHAHYVSHIVLHIGVLSGVEADLLLNAFSIARAGTVARAAVLEIEPQPIRVQCRECGAESEAEANHLLCAACGGWQTQLISGDELILARVAFDMPRCSQENLI